MPRGTVATSTNIQTRIFAWLIMTLPFTRPFLERPWNIRKLFLAIVAIGVVETLCGNNNLIRRDFLRRHHIGHDFSVLGARFSNASRARPSKKLPGMLFQEVGYNILRRKLAVASRKIIAYLNNSKLFPWKLVFFLTCRMVRRVRFVPWMVCGISASTTQPIEDEGSQINGMRSRCVSRGSWRKCPSRQVSTT